VVIVAKIPKNNNQDKETYQLELLAEVASLYYEQDLTQKEIGDKLFISRSRVSRLLTAAKKRGVVTIAIHHAGERSFELERMLERKYRLDKAYVLNSNNLSYSDVLRLMGIFAAKYINNQVKNNHVIGITWGKSVSHTIAALNPNPSLKLEVVQAIGGTLVQNPIINIPSLLQTFMSKFDATAIYLNAPLYVDDPQTCVQLKAEPAIAYALEKARNADIILTGIGEASEETFQYMWFGFDINKELNQLLKAGVSGSICAQTYDINGTPVSSVFNSHVMGITLEELKTAKKVVAVSGGRRKAEAVLGALRGGYIDVLVTDSQCVNEMVRFDKN